MATMTVRYKFMSAKDFSEIRFPGRYVTVADLKLEILNAKFKAKFADSSSRRNSIWNGLCLGNDHDLLIIDAQTNTPYSDESALITNNSSVLLRRVPGDRQRRSLNTAPIEVMKEDGQSDPSSVATNPSTVVSQDMTYSSKAATKEIDDLDDDGEFGGDVYAVPSKVVDAPPARVDEDEEKTKIRELVNTPALGSWSQAASTLTGGWDSRKRKHPYSALPPPSGYVCHRCGIKGHFIKDCPTNGDPKFNLSKRMRSSCTAASTPSIAAESEFNKQMEGISHSKVAAPAASSGGSSNISSSSSYTVVVPPELHCPLCRGVMKNAVFVKRCCFQSFCEGCIRDHVKKSKSCACGAANGDAVEGDFVPNVTVRNMISSILQRSSCSGSGSTSVGSNSNSSTVVRT
ncbi:E3 ubiquitin ligase PQT3-like [Linum perenne]